MRGLLSEMTRDTIFLMRVKKSWRESKHNAENRSILYKDSLTIRR